MSASYNRIILAGNMTRDPEMDIRESGNGGDAYARCRFGLAVNEKRGDDERVDFFDCTAYGKLAETIGNYKQKGDPVLVEGKMRFFSWEDDEGNRRSKHGVHVQSVQFLNRAGEGGANGGGGRKGGGDPNEGDYDDLPF